MINVRLHRRFEAVDMMAAEAAAVQPRHHRAGHMRWLCFKHAVLIPAGLFAAVTVPGTAATLAILGLI